MQIGLWDTLHVVSPQPVPLPWYLFSGRGCRAATTPPSAAAERLAQAARFAGSLCAARRGATRRSPSFVAARATPAADALQLRRVDATSSTSLDRYIPGQEEEGQAEGEGNFRPQRNASQSTHSSKSLNEKGCSCS